MRRRLLVCVSLGLALGACRAPLGSGGAACGATHVSPGWGRPAAADVAAACARSVPGCATPARPAALAGHPGWERGVPVDRASPSGR